MKKSTLALSVAIAGLLALNIVFAGQSRAQCVEAVPLPPVHRTYIRRDVVEPGVYDVGRSASEYGWVYTPGEPPRRILLRPYKNFSHFQRPYIAWSREHVTIQPEGYRWRPVPVKPDC